MFAPPKNLARNEKIKSVPNCLIWRKDMTKRSFLTPPLPSIVAVSKILKTFLVNKDEKDFTGRQTHRNRTPKEDHLKVRQPYQKKTGRRHHGNLT